MTAIGNRQEGARRAPRRLILASTSGPRRDLLARLGIAFETAAPDVDETPLPGEDGRTLTRRLAEAKAERVARAQTDALVIGSDQVAVLDGKIIGKPGTHERAAALLAAASGREMHFMSAVCLIDAGSGRRHRACIETVVRFRALTAAMIEDYLRRDHPLGCAGAFRSESLGAALVASMTSEDPTAILGMPLIRLVDLLEAEGVHVLGHS